MASQQNQGAGGVPSTHGFAPEEKKQVPKTPKTPKTPRTQADQIAAIKKLAQEHQIQQEKKHVKEEKSARPDNIATDDLESIMKVVGGIAEGKSDLGSSAVMVNLSDTTTPLAGPTPMPSPVELTAHQRKALKLNLKPSPVDTRDYTIKPKLMMPTLPITVDLAPNCTVVKDQGVLGSCTAFSSVGCMEYLHKYFAKEEANLSEKFTYYATRVNVEGGPATDTGAYVRDALKSLVKYGSCLESTCPYDADCSSKPSDAAYAEAATYQALQYAKFDDTKPNTTMPLLKAQLAGGLPFIGGIICYENIYSDVKGVIPEPSGNPIGGHAILFVGYDDNKKLFKFKNSWNVKWGDNGYGYLPYSYFTSGNMFDLWTLYKVEDGKMPDIGLDVNTGGGDAPAPVPIPIVNPVQPTPAPTPAPTPPIPNPDSKTVEEVLKTIISNLGAALDKKQSSQLFEALMAQYKTQPKIVLLLYSMKIQLMNMAI